MPTRSIMNNIWRTESPSCRLDSCRFNPRALGRRCGVFWSDRYQGPVACADQWPLAAGDAKVIYNQMGLQEQEKWWIIGGDSVYRCDIREDREAGKNSEAPTGSGDLESCPSPSTRTTWTPHPLQLTTAEKANQPHPLEPGNNSFWRRTWMDIHRLLTGLWAGAYLDDTAHPRPIDLSFSVKVRGTCSWRLLPFDLLFGTRVSLCLLRPAQINTYQTGLLLANGAADEVGEAECVCESWALVTPLTGLLGCRRNARLICPILHLIYKNRPLQEPPMNLMRVTKRDGPRSACDRGWF